MVLGIGTLNPVGIAGALFHMLNNSIYKSCLFLCAGAVEKKTGSTDLSELGGLAGQMPVTFCRSWSPPWPSRESLPLTASCPSGSSTRG